MSDNEKLAECAPSLDLSALLAAHLAQFVTLPFLFIGSGFSRRYLDLETWQSLLSRFAGPTNKPFRYFLTKADGSLPRAATFLAEEFLETWWKEGEYEVSRSEMTDGNSKFDFPLKYEIAKYLRDKSAGPLCAAYETEIELLKAANVDGIITTNWDLVLERVFPDFQVFKGQEELLFSDALAIAEIYKIHGCCTLPESLVLTDIDYANFNARNPYLAPKLLAIFLEHPVIFIGYSLRDPNVTGILTAIAACMRTENLDKLQDRLIFIEWQPGGDVNFARTSITIDQKIIPAITIKASSFVPIFIALSGNRPRFPAKLLRRLKSHIYQLVKTHDPSVQMYVKDLDKEDESSPIQIVYGVGSESPGSTTNPSWKHTEHKLGDELSSTIELGKTGYRGIPRDRLLHDIVFGLENFDAELIVLHTLPDLLTATRKLPIFKYIRAAGFFDGKDLSVLSKKVQTAMQANYTKFGTVGKANESRRRRHPAPHHRPPPHRPPRHRPENPHQPPPPQPRPRPRPPRRAQPGTKKV